MLRTILPVFVFLVVAQSGHAQSAFLPKNLGGGVNTAEYDEVSPVISSDRKTLFFARVNDPQNSHGVKNSADILISRSDKGVWGTATRLTVLNTGRYNQPLSLTADGQQLLLSIDGDLAISTRNGDQWNAPEKLALKASKEASLTADGKYLIYSKGSHLYISEKGPDGKWGKAQQAKNLNAGKIHAPFLTDDNKTLYFTSTGKEKALDVYHTVVTGAGWDSWSEPASVNDSINTIYAETSLRTNNGAWGYFAATGATGKSDIFTAKLYEDTPYIFVSGTVVNSVTKRPLRNKDITILVDGATAGFFTVNRDSGTYTLRLPFGKKFSIKAQVDHYTAHAYTIDGSAVKEYKAEKLNLEEGPLPYVLVKGRLLIKNTGKAIPATAKPKIVVDGEVVDSAFVDVANGTYALKVKHGASYYVQVSASRFESFPEVVDVTMVDGYEEITLDLQADAEKMAIVSGKIINKKTGTALESTVPVHVNVEGVSSVAASLDSLAGTYDLRLPLRAAYMISAEATDYYPVYETIDVKTATNEVQIAKDLVLVPVERGQSVRLNVVVGAGKNALSASSLPELDKLVAFLEANPKVKIEIGSHSEKGVNVSTVNQAKVVANYITSKGISKSRVTARGYGSTRPIASNNTSEGKALNKRIEFTITDK